MRRTRRLAWAMWGVTLLGNAIGVSLLVANRTTAVPVSPMGYNGFWSFAAVMFTGLAFASVGALVASRRPGNAIGWLFCGTGILATAELLGSQYAIYGLLTEPGSVPRPELGAWVYDWTGFVAACLTATFVLMLFPDGRLPSPAWRPLPWLTGVGIVLSASSFAFRPGPLLLSVFVENPLGIDAGRDTVMTIGLFGFGLVLGGLVLSIASLAVRYRRAHVGERQQIKWIAYVAGLHAVALLIFYALLLNSNPVPVLLAASAIPIATGIAILRYRLYDIDLLINRTLVYGSLSATLLGTYVLSVLGLSTVLRPLTGSSDLAVAGSTLAVVAFSGPLRARIQRFVDRRFYRSRYDAARTLDAFGLRLRDEVDLDSLRADLLDVVHDTVRPAHASVWLRERS